MCFIWIIIALAAISMFIEGAIEGRYERKCRGEYKKNEYSPYVTRGFNTAYVYEAAGSFHISNDPEYYRQLPSEEEETLYYDDNLEVSEQEEQPVEDVPNDEYVLEEESEESKAAYESLKAIREKMKAVQPSYKERPEEKITSGYEAEKNPAEEEEGSKSHGHREELQLEKYTDMSAMGEEIMSDEVYTLGTEVRRYYDPPEHVRPENIGISSVKVYVVSLRFDWGWRSNYYPRVVLLVEMYGKKLYTWLTTEDGEEYLSREDSEKNGRFLHQDDKEQLADRFAVKYFYNEWYRAYHPEKNVLGEIYNKETKES